MTKKRGDISDSEKSEWMNEIRDVKPIARDDIAKIEKPRKSIKVTPSEPNIPLQRRNLEPIAFDFKIAKQIRRGITKPDALIDLHGLTLHRAHNALVDFVKREYAKGSRILLIITGKGQSNKPSVIREEARRWIQEDDIRPMVLSFKEAERSHGGSGAFYLHLRKERGSI